MKLDSIFLIDDDHISNFNNEQFLKKLDIANDIFVKSNGKEALSHLEEAIEGDNTSRNLIIVDLMMPIIDGFQFIRKFQLLANSYADNYKIAVLTQYDSNFNVARIQRMGDFPVVSKPLTKEKLNKVLHSLGILAE
ncbi:MAG: response regulator [Cytophagaceae bacterium]|nr:response regulator [Cytophagaceae bacterium]